MTAQTRSLVADNERTLTFQVASLFVNVQLAESTLDLAEKDLKSFQQTVDLSELRFKKGAISEDDYLKIKLQLLQFETDVQQAELAKVQALSDLRQQLGYESVLRRLRCRGRIRLPAAQGQSGRLAVEGAAEPAGSARGAAGRHRGTSQYELAKSESASRMSPFRETTRTSTASMRVTFYGSIPLPIFNRNQGEIARTRFAITQAQEQEKAANGQVMTDVRDAYEGCRRTTRIVQLYRSGYLDVAQKDRDISEYAYQRGAVSLLDFLDAERSYRATQLAYRQALASYLLALEQLRQAVGTRTLP